VTCYCFSSSNVTYDSLLLLINYRTLAYLLILLLTYCLIVMMGINCELLEPLEIFYSLCNLLIVVPEYIEPNVRQPMNKIVAPCHFTYLHRSLFVLGHSGYVYKFRVYLSLTATFVYFLGSYHRFEFMNSTSFSR
jgi:hypothetical protein